MPTLMTNGKSRMFPGSGSADGNSRSTTDGTEHLHDAIGSVCGAGYKHSADADAALTILAVARAHFQGASG